METRLERRMQLVDKLLQPAPQTSTVVLNEVWSMLRYLEYAGQFSKISTALMLKDQGYQTCLGAKDLDSQYLFQRYQGTTSTHVMGLRWRDEQRLRLHAAVKDLDQDGKPIFWKSGEHDLFLERLIATNCWRSGWIRSDVLQQAFANSQWSWEFLAQRLQAIVGLQLDYTLTEQLNMPIYRGLSWRI